MEAPSKACAANSKPMLRALAMPFFKLLYASFPAGGDFEM
jgi:hypothetical protein